VPAGTYSAADVRGIVTWSGAAGVWAGAVPVTYLKGQVIHLDPAGKLFAAIGAGNLRAYVQGQDDVGHAALANLAL
jgi:hypothetical protein